MAGGGGKQRRVLRYFVTPGVQRITSSITRPIMEANNFELKSCSYFHGAAMPIWGHPIGRPELTPLGLFRRM